MLTVRKTLFVGDQLLCLTKETGLISQCLVTSGNIDNAFVLTGNKTMKYQNKMRITTFTKVKLADDQTNIDKYQKSAFLKLVVKAL